MLNAKIATVQRSAAKTSRLTAKIRSPLRKGEQRRHPEVSENDPARQRLVFVVSLRETDPTRFATESKKFVADNIGLAITYARSLNSAHVPQEDLIHAAAIGLLEALRRFDVTKAGRFSTFAVWRMKYECDMLLHDKEGSIVKVPGQLRDDQRILEDVARKLSHLLGVPPNDEQLLIALREEEDRRNKEKAERDGEDAKPAASSWAKADAARVREVRESYTGAAYAPLDPTTPSEEHHIADQRMTVREAILLLPSPMLQAVIADEYDIEGFDLSYVPTCPVKRETALQLALRLLRRRLER